MISNIMFLILGWSLGFLVTILIYEDTLLKKEKNYKKHLYSEIRLDFILFTIKDYVKNQLNNTKTKHIIGKMVVKGNPILLYGYYIAFKDMEKVIKELEDNSAKLIK